MNIDFTKQFEGRRLTAYPDPGTGGAPWTIGDGHTKGVKEGDTCTPEQADQWLADDLAVACSTVAHFVKVPLTDNQKTALADFVFNVGMGNFESSTLLKKLNAEDYEGAADEFGRWIYAGGRVLPGLVKRRAAGAALFRLGMTSPCQPSST